jgi:hypothetical protein
MPADVIAGSLNGPGGRTALSGVGSLMTAFQIQSPHTPDRYVRTHTRHLNRPNLRRTALEALVF